MMRSAEFWIERLELEPLPGEGGMFREIYRSPELVPAGILPGRFGGDRCFSTSIYYLLRHPAISVLHRLKQDEIWHFYYGSPLSVCIIGLDGSCRVDLMGNYGDRVPILQLAINAGEIFGAAVAKRGSYSLVGCTVAPGFEFDDMEKMRREELLREHPQHHDLIMRYTRDE